MKIFLISLFTLLCCIFFLVPAYSQNIISGMITDSISSEPLVGAVIRISGSSSGVTTNESGKYLIEVPSNNSNLIVSYLGYQSKKILINNRNHINIQLVSKKSKLNEVVVVGYGTKKKVDLTGSVSVINSDQINRKQVGRVSAALQGLAPGLTVTQSSGQPGADGGKLRVWGVGTFGNAGKDPLVLVDGIEKSLDDLDPNDIESISILKDAASAAIYGSRAANGVILVTTKRAKSEQLHLSYDGYIGWQSPTTMPKLVNGLQHMILLNEANTNVGKAPPFQESYIEKYKKNYPSDVYPNTDWQALTMTGSGLIQSHSLALSIGSDRIKVRTSFNYFNQKGIIPNTGYKRYTLRINTDIKASDKIKFKVDLWGKNTFSYQPGISTSSIFFHMNGRVPANQEGILSDGRYGQGWLGHNPIAAANASGYQNNKYYAAIINLQGEWKPFKNFSISLIYDPEISDNLEKNFDRTYKTYYGNGELAYINPSKNSLERTSSRSLDHTFRALINYSKEFNENNFTLLGGFEQIKHYSESFSAYRENLILQDYQVLNNGSLVNQKANGSGGTEYDLISYFGRLNYNYNDKYLFEANLRYDGSSRFAKGNKFGLFPSFSVGWRISQEKFLKKFGILNNLKLRASWGKLGNQNIGYYPAVSTVNISRHYILNDQAVSAAAITELGNPGISWETTEVFNVGVDMELMRRLSLTAEYYIKNTKDILLKLPIPSYIGMSPPYQNAGRVRNVGWDLSVGYFNSLHKLKYNIKLILSDVKNRITDLAGTGPYISGENIDAVGHPINAIYGYKSDGLFQTQEEVEKHATQFSPVAPGDIKYVDQNGDGMINGDDRVFLGSSIPRYTYSLNFHASYKAFDFNMFLQGVGKEETYLDGSGVWAFYVGSTAYVYQAKNRWTPDHTNASYPRFTFNVPNNTQFSDYWLLNGAYLRIKNLQIGYSLPQNLLEKIFIRHARIYISGQNILTFDHFIPGFDVEMPEGGISHYPIEKVYSVGMNIEF